MIEKLLKLLQRNRIIKSYKTKYFFNIFEYEVGVMLLPDYHFWKEMRYKQTQGWTIRFLWIFFVMKPNYLKQYPLTEKEMYHGNK